jgi:hypothetical protein
MKVHGTNFYPIGQQGKGRAPTFTIVIEHTASTVTVTETFERGGETAKTERTLDPVTFSTRTYNGENNETVRITAKGATYRGESVTETVSAPVSAPSAVFDFPFAGEFATLPAMITRAGVTRYNEYAPGMDHFEVATVSVLPANAARPSSVPATDKSIALDSSRTAGTLWYDPQTFVLREIDLTPGISYVRI